MLELVRLAQPELPVAQECSDKYHQCVACVTSGARGVFLCANVCLCRKSSTLAFATSLLPLPSAFLKVDTSVDKSNN